MFGIGGQEVVLIGLVLLVIFGPSKLPDMARDFGRFVNNARRSVDEFKADLVSEEERSPEVSRDLEENTRSEEVAVVAQSAPDEEQRPH